MPADINFAKEDEVLRWLSNKPREVVAVFAARAALRVAPPLAVKLNLFPGGETELVGRLFCPHFAL